MRTSTRPTPPLVLALMISLGGSVAPTGCDAGSALLVVDLRTDYVPGIEFERVEIEVVDLESSSREIMVSRSTEAIEGVRLAEYADVPTGLHTIEVRLMATSDTQLATHRLLVELDDARAATVVITRDCHGVTCESGGLAPRACLGGRCVDARCTEETPEHCGDPACVTDAECAGGDACATARCIAGACTLEANAGVCDPNEWCNPDTGCSARRWVRSRGADEPGLLVAPQMAVSSAGEPYLYGGVYDTDFNVLGDYSNRLWQLVDGAWIEVVCEDASCDPGPRIGHTMLAAGDAVYLLGGFDDSGAPRDDVWVLRGGILSQRVTAAGGPEARGCAYAAFIPETGIEGSILLFGGTVDRMTGLDDTWLLDLETMIWSEPAPGPSAPSARWDCGAGTTHDGTRVVIFGGQPAAGVGLRLDDAWAWDRTWAEICSPCTGRGRRGAGVIYDPTASETLIFGGIGEGLRIEGTWALAASGRAPLRDSFFLPQRGHFASAYDPLGERVIVYGGRGNCGAGGEDSICAETWRYERF